MDLFMNSAVCLLERAAEKFCNKTAFEDMDSKLSFTELRARSRALASGILSRVKTGREYPIIIHLPKSVDSIVAFMGVLYTGSPYAPVEYTIAPVRMETITANLKPSMIITDAEGKESLSKLALDTEIAVLEELTGGSDDAAVNDALYKVCDLDGAYIMHTSGSTGVPKGVTISNRGVIDYASWIKAAFDINENDIIGLNSPFHFDNSIFDVYTTLYTGAKTLIIPEKLFMYPDKLMEYVAEKEVSVIFWVPTVMISVANSGALDAVELPKLKNILFAGEVMPCKQLNIWRKKLPDSAYTNLYGPTETNVCTYYKVDREFSDSDSLPIGKACENMRVLILNEDNKRCGIGEPGELCISTSGRSLEYWNAPDISSRVFVQNPLNTKYHDKIYRTGDLVYEAEDGNIMFMGRRDNQIKLRGNRIELGDLENAAAQLDGVLSACALFDKVRQEIVLFVETDKEIAPRKYRMSLWDFVPGYMVPARVVTMAKFPHTASGKIDRVGLRKAYIEGDS
ncbi:MAG: amino acid adenylation domain-containing protein [Clostridia bacterium]|nr:amino acid adenylation domain-containing protein [Clostridia bacterium]